MVAGARWNFPARGVLILRYEKRGLAPTAQVDSEEAHMRKKSALAAKAGRLCLLASVLLGLAAAAPAPVTVTVTMVDYRFEPDHLTFQRDVHYRLHLENHGKETHEFTAPLFFATAQIDNPDVLNRERTEVVMQPGDVKD
ncbi:MAG: cupredoxin domain-containing protein, partial [Xanthobacteraceae bacterium]